MTTILRNSFQIGMTGGAAEYTTSLRVMVKALAALEEKQDRENLAELLLQMLPQENQIKSKPE